MINGEVEIILVEDDPNDAELIMRVLQKNHLANHIILVNDGAEAVDFFFGKGGYADKHTGGCPKVVLLDIKLPKVDGIEVLRRLRSDDRTKDMPVVMLTSSNQDKDIKAAYELGANSYVTKPIKFEEFVKSVTDLGVYWLMLNVPPV